MGKIFVAGGNTGLLDEVRSAEMYDPATNRWHHIASLGSDMARFDAAEWRGRLYVTEGWQWPFHFSPRGFVLDPTAGVWEAMQLGMSEGWTGMSAVVHNTLFIVAQADGGMHS